MGKQKSKIEEYKVLLEDLYLKAKRGEGCMEQVLALSRELDRLLVEETPQSRPLSNQLTETPSALEMAKSS